MTLSSCPSGIVDRFIQLITGLDDQLPELSSGRTQIAILQGSFEGASQGVNDGIFYVAVVQLGGLVDDFPPAPKYLTKLVRLAGHVKHCVCLFKGLTFFIITLSDVMMIADWNWLSSGDPPIHIQKRELETAQVAMGSVDGL